MSTSASSAVYRLIEAGLVVIEHETEPQEFTIIRPASLAGTMLWEEGYTSIMGANFASVLTNAPPASLKQLKKKSNGWEVDISIPAAPGPGPVWFHERFPNVADAVEAIHDCYFGNRIDFTSEALWPEFRRRTN